MFPLHPKEKRKEKHTWIQNSALRVRITTLFILSFLILSWKLWNPIDLRNKIVWNNHRIIDGYKQRTEDREEPRLQPPKNEYPSVSRASTTSVSITI